MAPASEKTLPLLQKYLESALHPGYAYGWDWNTLAQFYERIDGQGTSINLAPLVAQGAVRLAVKGFDATPGEPIRDAANEKAGTFVYASPVPAACSKIGTASRR